jgi:hypothetical protein
MKIVVFACAVVFVGLLGGCVDVEDDVRARAANDFSCKQEEIKVNAIGAGAFRAGGCGYSQIYDCVASESFRGTTTNYSCRPEKGGD